MKVMFCDVCGREMSQHEAGAISRAALADLAGKILKEQLYCLLKVILKNH